jgi:uncharacterized protein (TIGR04255 family)
MSQCEQQVDSGERKPAEHLAEVAFEARFSTLYSIPKKIDEFQQLIFEEFDKSNELKLQGVTLQPNQEPVLEAELAWEFIHKDGDPIIRLFKNKIIVFSKAYSSYDAPEGNSYKDRISYTIERFESLFKINKFTRMGLRYINTFEVEEKSNDWLERYFKPLYDLEKYPMQDTLEFKFALRIKREKANLVIQGGYISKDNLKYVLDFDAYKEDCRTEDYLNVLNDLHDSIKSEFKSTITEEMQEKLGVLK